MFPKHYIFIRLTETLMASSNKSTKQAKTMMRVTVSLQMTDVCMKEEVSINIKINFKKKKQHTP